MPAVLFGACLSFGMSGGCVGVVLSALPVSVGCYSLVLMRREIYSFSSRERMVYPLMPKATAVWLIDNTSLTFDQIAEFCGMHVLEVRGIADGEVMRGVIGMNPLHTGQLTKTEIERCEADESARLKLSGGMEDTILAEQRKKKGHYTPIVRRQDKPDAIVWLIKNCPEMGDMQISKLIGTTKPTVGAVRNRTHWNANNLRPKDPVLLGLCTQTELNAMYESAKTKVVAREVKDARDSMRMRSPKANIGHEVVCEVLDASSEGDVGGGNGALRAEITDKRKCAKRKVERDIKVQQ